MNPRPNDPNFPDVVLASAARFLIDGAEEDAASILLSCSIETYSTEELVWDGYESVPGDVYKREVMLRCPRAAYDLLTDSDNFISQAIRRAIRAVMPSSVHKVWNFEVRGEQVNIDPDWRTELLEIARGRGVHNQIADEERANVRTWNNLRFRSASEVRVAMALDRAQVYFLPNNKGRLNTPQGRENREADFLVCAEGKWGILLR